MHISRAIVNGALALCCWEITQIASGQLTSAGEILFNNYDLSSGQPVMQLSTIKQDGTGNTLLAVNLPEPGLPAVSRDGRYVALTSEDPKKAFTLSRDVFLYDLKLAQLEQLTSFPNNWNRLDTNSMGNVDISQASYTLPWYKAFSPEGLRLAISSVVVSGATFTYTNKLNPQDNSLASGFTEIPSLSIYNINGTAPILVAVGAGNPDIHAGDGVDWAPNLDLLAWPVTTNITFGGFYGGNGPVTAIYVMLPVADAMGTGHALPLTFPQGSSGLLPNLMGTYVEWQTDYSPAFSPDCKQVAYIRGDSITASTISGYVTQPSLRIVNVNATGDHEVTNFNAGVYITHLSWSPDGTQLVFDAGPQAVGPLNFPYLAAVPQTDALYTINTNGSGLKQLRAPPATWPAWSPGLATPAPPRLALRPAPGGKQLIISWPAANTNWLLETSSKLGALANWQFVTTQQVVTNGQQTVILSPSPGTMFFRLRST